jgi:hypothetical protein
MTGIRQDKARLAALHPEAVCEQRGVIIEPIRRFRVYLGVEGL